MTDYFFSGIIFLVFLISLMRVRSDHLRQRIIADQARIIDAQTETITYDERTIASQAEELRIWRAGPFARKN
jgi:hypothetical protein